MNPFFTSLAKGDLTLSYSLRNNGKLHLVRISQSKNENLKKVSNDGLARWTGVALCGTENGNYFWEPRTSAEVDPNDAEVQCTRCFQRWRALEKPGVKGWTLATPAGELEEWPLPFGWSEVPVEGHPFDVAPGNDPAKVLNERGEAAGELRVEVRRWRRGDRIVRIVDHKDDAGRGSSTFFSSVSDVIRETRCVSGSPQECRKAAHTIMFKGGMS